MTTHKQSFRRAHPEIRRVLLEVWDPIGVKDEPRAQNEYDSYIGQIYRRLVEGASDTEISDYLYGVETEQMGLPGHDKELLLSIVHALRKIAV